MPDESMTVLSPTPALTPAVLASILDAIRTGCSVRQAVLASGVSVATFRHWLGEGRRQSNGIHRQLLLGYRQARAEAEVRHAAVVSQAALRDWKAAAWWLEHRVPARWAKPSRKVGERSAAHLDPSPAISDEAIEAAHDFLARLEAIRKPTTGPPNLDGTRCIPAMPPPIASTSPSHSPSDKENP